MATNSASSNPIGAATGPISGKPPPASAETKAAITDSANADPTGQSQGGKDGGPGPDGEKKVKSEKELEKERKKAEKQKKFAEKQMKTLNADGVQPKSKGKEKKAKAESAKEEIPEYVEETPAGQKKSGLPAMTFRLVDADRYKVLKSLEDPLYKAYNPTIVESAWYSWWEKEGYFKPEYDSKGEVKKAGYFSIAVPPPNVTGALHMGHALTNALQDTMIRWNRMRGFTTLWLPGCDHAGIATQSVVENMLRRRQNKSRHDLGREKFTNLVWDWKEE
ncbi:MAG: hypothetical protein M4579_003230 [Chaenotheca gracillima]|nr:MAG: hypothetical protein M4579_003230 [Chaenotheca gracillima]